VKNTIAFTACALVCGFVVVSFFVKSKQNTNKKLEQKMKNWNGSIHYSVINNAILEQVSFHPNGSYLMSGSQDKSLIIFDLLEARPILNLLGHKSSVNAVKFSSGKDEFILTTCPCLRHQRKMDWALSWTACPGCRERVVWVALLYQSLCKCIYWYMVTLHAKRWPKGTLDWLYLPRHLRLRDSKSNVKRLE